MLSLFMNRPDKFFVDFSEYYYDGSSSDRKNPQDWTKRLEATYNGVHYADFVGYDSTSTENFVALYNYNFNENRVACFTWNLADNENDVELVAKMRTDNPYGTQMRLMARISGTQRKEDYENKDVNGYFLDFYGGTTAASTQQIRCGYYLAPSNPPSTEIDYTVFTSGQKSYLWQADKWYWARLKLEGNNYKAKWWASSESEPSTWGFEITTTHVSTGKWNGISGYQKYSHRYYDCFGIALNGETAPKEKVNRYMELAKGTLSGEDKINARSVCSFIMNDLYDYGKPAIGTQVQIKDNEGNIIFGGSVDAGTKTRIGSCDTLKYQIPCVDFHQLCDKRIVIETYENKTANYIINDIINNYLAYENITPGEIATGPTFTKVVFNYQNITACLNEISELSGYQWRINYDKTLDFFIKSANNAAYNINNNSQIWDIEIEDNRNDYRNIQYIRGTKGKTNQRTELFTGDNVNRNFLTAFQISEQPTILIDDVAVSTEDIGIRQKDKNKEWYWLKGEKELNQSSTGVVLSSTQELKIQYIGEYPTIVKASKDTQIKDRINKEANSGIYENVEYNENIDEDDAGLEYAHGKLRRYAQINQVITYKTEKNGLRAGQIQHFERTIFGIDNDYLIESVRFKAIGDGYIEYTIRLISGESVGGWANFFKSLTRKGEKFIIRENEILVKSKNLSENIGLTETIDITKMAPESRIGYAKVGMSEIGST